MNDFNRLVLEATISECVKQMDLPQVLPHTGRQLPGKPPRPERDPKCRRNQMGICNVNYDFPVQPARAYDSAQGPICIQNTADTQASCDKVEGMSSFIHDIESSMQGYYE